MESGGSLTAIDDVFISIDLDTDVAYVAYEDGSGIRWDEVSRADGELLASMGGLSLIHLGSSSRVGIASATSAAVGPQRVVTA